MRIIITLLFLYNSSLLFAQNDFAYYHRQGNEKHKKEQFNEAILDYSSALKNKKTAKDNYQVANVYMARAYCKMYLQKYKLAKEDISEAIKLLPEYSELYLAGSIIHLRNKEYDECLQQAEAGLALKPDYEDLIIVKAKAKFKKKNYIEALSELDTILYKFNPRSIEAYNLKGMITHAQKDHAAGLAIYTKVLDLDAQNIEAFYNRGICKAYLKDFEGALSDMNRGMNIDSSQKFIGKNNIAYFIKFEEKDYQGAISILTEAIAQYPDFAYAYCNRGYAKLQMNDLSGARTDIEKSIKLNNKNPYVYKVLGQLLIVEKKSKLACDSFKKALELEYKELYDDEVDGLINENCK